MTEKPRYRVQELSLIGNVLVQPGTEIDDYEGLPAANLLPLNAAAEARVKDYVAFEKIRLAKLDAMYGAPNVQLDALVAAAVAEANRASAARIAELEAQLAAVTETAADLA